MEVEMVLNSGYQEGRELRKGSSSDGAKQVSFRRYLDLTRNCVTLEGLGDHGSWQIGYFSVEYTGRTAISCHL